MNNMLYIIIGLVIIVLVAVLVLRKNKTKETAPQPIKQAEKRSAVANSATKPQTVNTEQNTTKFDPLTVAQRFIDQQRYDKAIEALERGIAKHPQDSKLLLKLLNVYAITDQYDDFNNVYATIKNSGDTSAITDADQLKTLLEQEHTQSYVQPETDTDSSFESLDFDLSTTQTATGHEPYQAADLDKNNIADLDAYSEPVASPKDTNNNFNVDDHFDLTLDDLETTDTQANTSTPSAQDESSDIDVVHDSEEVAPSRNLNVDDDFTLSFDEVADNSISSETNLLETDLLETDIEEVKSEDLPNTGLTDSSSDDFVLNFDDLSQESDEAAIQNLTETNNVIEVANNEDLTSLLEDGDKAADSFEANLDNTLTTENEDSFEANNGLKLENSPQSNENTSDSQEDILSAFDELSFDDELSIEDNSQPTVNFETAAIYNDADSVSYTDTDAIAPETDVTDSEVVDNHTPVDDTFAADLSAAAPVDEEDNLNSDDLNDQDAIEQSSALAPVTDFAAQFAADFDFVSTLNNNQITLDLAGQYLQLGEYDSAARLLNEVIAEGNSEQQHQAQEMLARTA